MTTKLTTPLTEAAQAALEGADEDVRALAAACAEAPTLCEHGSNDCPLCQELKVLAEPADERF